MKQIGFLKLHTWSKQRRALSWLLPSVQEPFSDCLMAADKGLCLTIHMAVIKEHL